MNIFYNASAGTGKTFKITEKYIELVLNKNIDPKRILLMSFNTNAAYELKMGVIEKFTAHISNLDNEKFNEYHTILHQIETSPICTMDAYCQTLLKENAIDAGVNPNFIVLEEDKINEILEELAHQQIIYNLEKDNNFKELCKNIKFNVYQKQSTNVPLTAIKLIHKIGSLGITIDNSEMLLEPPIQSIKIDDIKDLLNSYKFLSPKSKAYEIKNDFENFLKEANDIDDLLTIISAKKYKIRRYKQELQTKLCDLLEQARTEYLYSKNFPLVVSFAKYLYELYIEFERYKKTNSFLTFDDIKRCAVKLIKEEIVTPQFDYIMVDEVQDISQVQYDLIKSLWSKKTSLIVCGDHKQSIYNWRSAEAKIFKGLQKQIKSREGKIIPLNKSWRSKTSIIEPINKIFSTAFLEDNQPCYKNYKHEALKSNENLENLEKLTPSPAVEYLTPDDAILSSSTSDRINAEMRCIARRIKLLVENKDNLWSPMTRYNDKKFAPTSTNNSYQYSDILILMRTSTHLSFLQKALEDENIPYVLKGKGRSLFSTTPARDLSLLLTTICNPLDDFNIIGFLRSPWVGLSDVQITKKILNHKNKSLLEAFPEIYKKIQSSRKDLSIYLISEIARHWISECKYDAFLASQNNGSQALANLHKLIDWIRQRERDSRINAASIARRLKKNILDPPKNNEATLNYIDQNVVQIMSIHTAKGLTKRVICIPELSFNKPSDKDFAFLKLINNEPKLFLNFQIFGENISSPSLKYIKKEVTAESERELINLFYVAMTRARDLIILSSSNDRNGKWVECIQSLRDENMIKTVYFDCFKKSKNHRKKDKEIPLNPDYIKNKLNNLQIKEIQPGFQRIATTELIKKNNKFLNSNEFNNIKKEYGTLGHKVLENAAHQNWIIDVDKQIRYLNKTFHLSNEEVNLLKKQLKIVITMMKKQTKNAPKILIEFPFLIKKKKQFIDGVIDLVTIDNDRISIYDYKFSNLDQNELIDFYKEQINIYNHAIIKKLNPLTPIINYLVLISDTKIKLIDL